MKIKVHYFSDHAILMKRDRIILLDAYDNLVAYNHGRGNCIIIMYI